MRYFACILLPIFFTTADPRENQNEGISMLKIDLNPKATDDVTRLAVLLTPVGDKWPKLNPPIIKSLAGW